jgi:hypothetical protein
MQCRTGSAAAAGELPILLCAKATFRNPRAPKQSSVMGLAAVMELVPTAQTSDRAVTFPGGLRQSIGFQTQVKSTSI